MEKLIKSGLTIGFLVLVLLVLIKLIENWLYDMSIEFYPNTDYIPMVKMQNVVVAVNLFELENQKGSTKKFGIKIIAIPTYKGILRKLSDKLNCNSIYYNFDKKKCKPSYIMTGTMKINCIKKILEISSEEGYKIGPEEISPDTKGWKFYEIACSPPEKITRAVEKIVKKKGCKNPESCLSILEGK